MRRPRRGARLCRRCVLPGWGEMPRLHQILRATKRDKLSEGVIPLLISLCQGDDQPPQEHTRTETYDRSGHQVAREHPDAKPNEGAARDDEEKRRCRSSAPGPILHCFLIHRILGVLLRVCRHRDALSFLKPISQPMSTSCIAARPKRELAAICVTCSFV